jgi:hypothetical protein
MALLKQRLSSLSGIPPDGCYRLNRRNKDLTRILHPSPCVGKLWRSYLLEYPDPRLKVASPVTSFTPGWSNSSGHAETMYAARA